QQALVEVDRRIELRRIVGELRMKAGSTHWSVDFIVRRKKKLRGKGPGEARKFEARKPARGRRRLRRALLLALGLFELREEADGRLDPVLQRLEHQRHQAGRLDAQHVVVALALDAVDHDRREAVL